jgi:hypothetical protein
MRVTVGRAALRLACSRSKRLDVGTASESEEGKVGRIPWRWGGCLRIGSRAWIGLALHGLLGVPYLLSGLLAPVWAAIFLWTLWTGLLAVAIHQRTRRQRVVAVIPIIAAVVWAVTIWAVSRLSGGAA